MSEMPPNPNQYELPDEDPNQFELFPADELSEDSLKNNKTKGKTTLPAPDLLIDLSSSDRPIDIY